MKPLHALAELLAPGDAKLVAELDRADDPWEALSDGLEKRKRLWRIDWKTFPSDVIWSLDQILPKETRKGRWAWCDLDNYEDTKSTDQFLKIAATALAASGLGLVGIDQGSDEYHVTSLPFAKLSRAKELVKQARVDGELQVYSPKVKPPPPKPLPPPKKQPPTKRAKQFRVRGASLFRDKHSHAGGMIYEKGEKPEIWVAEVKRWPPAPRKLASAWRARIAWGSDGRHLIDGNRQEGKKQIGTTTLVEGGKSKALTLPDGVGVKRFAFLGADLIAFPGDWVYRTKAAKTPLVLVNGKWQPVPGLPKTKPTPPPKSQGSWDFAIGGVAKTADGTDVILWEGRGYEKVGAKWVARYDLGKCYPGEDLPSVPTTDGFYFVSQGQLRHVARGGKARRKLGKYERIEWICGGPDGTILVATIRIDSKRPAGVVYFPATDEYSVIPATAFSLRRDDWVEIIQYHPDLDLVVGLYEHDFTSATMAPVYGASLLALPRRKA